MTRYRFGRIVAGMTSAVGFVTAVLALLGLGVVAIEVMGGDRGALAFLPPLVGSLLAGLIVTVVSCAALALFDLADRACGP